MLCFFYFTPIRCNRSKLIFLYHLSKSHVIIPNKMRFRELFSNFLNVFTLDPEIPGQIKVTQNTYSMRIRLQITAGSIDYYQVLSTSICTSPTFMNVSYEVEKSIDSKNDIILITEPGACCSLNVAAVSNNVSSEVQTYTVQRRETGRYAMHNTYSDNFIAYTI